jgi:hypothetical protein
MVHRLPYEVLIGEPDTTLMRLCTLLGVPYHSAMFDHLKDST